MNRELELLILAYDAFLESRGEEAKSAAALFDSRLDDALERHPDLSRSTLVRMVEVSHRNWMKAHNKPSSLPPMA